MNYNLRYRMRATSIPAGRCRVISLWNSSIRTLTEPARGCSCCCTSTYTESGYGYRLGSGAAVGLADINEPAVCAWRSCPAQTAGPRPLRAAGAAESEWAFSRPRPRFRRQIPLRSDSRFHPPSGRPTLSPHPARALLPRRSRLARRAA